MSKALANGRQLINRGMFDVVMPDSYTPGKVFCDVCSSILVNDDRQVYDLYGCCVDCYRDFAMVDVRTWQAGKRPTPAELETALLSRSCGSINVGRSSA